MANTAPTSRASGLDLYTDFPFAPLDEQRAFLRDAEAAGYEGAWATENRHDPFLPIAAAAHRRQRIGVGTGVIALLARNPFTVAQAAWDLHYSTGGRFVLGVGTQLDGHLVARYGISAEAKHDRLCDAIAAVRELWRSWQEDREPRFESPHYTIKTCPPGYRPTTKLDVTPDIFLLCSTAADLELAHHADGIFTHPMWPSTYIAQAVAPIVAEIRRTRTRFPVIDGSVVATGETRDELEGARHVARQRVAGYWRQEKYDPVFAQLGLADAVQAFRAEISSGADPWRDDSAAALYRVFVCEAAFPDLAAAMHQRHTNTVTGVFPNIMSAMRRILPRDLVAEIARAPAAHRAA